MLNGSGSKFECDTALSLKSSCFVGNDRFINKSDNRVTTCQHWAQCFGYRISGQHKRVALSISEMRQLKHREVK